MGFSSLSKSMGRKPVTRPTVPLNRKNGTRSEAAPVGRYAVIAMQLGLLRPVAPVEILVGVERRRALQLVIVGVELVGLEPGVVAQPRPGQWQQIGSHAEEAA